MTNNGLKNNSVANTSNDKSFNEVFGSSFDNMPLRQQIETAYDYYDKPQNQSSGMKSYTLETKPMGFAGQSLEETLRYGDTSTENLKTYREHLFDGNNCGGMSPEFVDKIAYTESRGNCKNNINDYGCVNKENSAFGRYQMQKPALQDAQFMDKNKQFTKLSGVKNMQEFLDNPKAQETAFCNYLNKADQYNKNWNNYKYLGKNVQIGDLVVPMTKEMMLAGTHRQGANKLNQWLNDAYNRDGRLFRDPADDLRDPQKGNITKRFRDILYPRK